MSDGESGDTGAPVAPEVSDTSEEVGALASTGDGEAERAPAADDDDAEKDAEDATPRDDLVKHTAQIIAKGIDHMNKMELVEATAAFELAAHTAEENNDALGEARAVGA